MPQASAALLEALSEAGLARHWPTAVLVRAQALVGQVREFECAQQGAISAAQARVQGGALYRCQLSHSPGGRLRGDCDCPHAAGGAACKHQAALALVWRQQLSGAVLEAPAASPPPPAAAEPDWAQFVRAQPAAELAERLLRWAQRQPELKRELQRWQQAATPVQDLAQAKKVITTLLAPPRELWWRREVSAYVRKAESLLSLLAGWTARDAALGLGATEHAWLRLWKLLEQADDSDGDIQGLIVQVGELWVAALAAAGPQPAAYAERYLQLLEVDACGYLPLAAAVPAMGPAAQEKLLRRLGTRWEAAGPVEPGNPAWRARADYLKHLQALQRWDEALQVLRASLGSWMDQLDLIDLLEQAGRPREALQAAEAAHRAYPEQAELTERLIRAYQRDGWDEQVLLLYRELFERQPDSARYQALLQAAEAAGVAPAEERTRIWQGLHERLARSQGWQQQALGDLMLGLWTDAGEWADALDWLQQPRHAGEASLLRLARALPPEHAAAAAQLLKGLLAREMPRASSPYTQALRLVELALQRLEPEAGRLWLAWLRVEYRGKRRFIEGLPA